MKNGCRAAEKSTTSPPASGGIRGEAPAAGYIVQQYEEKKKLEASLHGTRSSPRHWREIAEHESQVSRKTQAFVRNRRR
jgi:hypothetical protein